MNRNEATRPGGDFRWGYALLVLASVVAAYSSAPWHVEAANPKAKPQWPMWGGRVSRNMVSDLKRATFDFEIDGGKNQGDLRQNWRGLQG